MNEYIKKLLRESLMSEFYYTDHLFDRLKDRVSELSSTEISDQAKNLLDRYLNTLTNLDFKEDESFAIKLLSISPNKNSPLYVNIGGRPYYRINDFMGVDSTGNEIWVTIRNNKATTIMLRKSIQPTYNLNVDHVIKHFGELKTAIRKGLVTGDVN
tara:strand:- start:108 stop:575 length:468 start_codon:yes stop_codon:yes gene_type:complete